MTKKKYDVVIGNPPYSRNMHLDFLADGINNLKPNGEGVFIHPATWALNEVPGQNIKNKIMPLNQHIKELNIVRNVFAENTKLSMDLSITKFTQKQTSLTVNDITNNNGVYSVNSLNQVSKWGNSKIYRNIQSAFFKSIEKNGSLGSKIITSIINLPSGECYFQFSHLVGTFCEKKRFKSDFFIFWTKGGAYREILTSKTIHPQANRVFTFKTKEEAVNFKAYLKTYIARFALSIAKFDRNINPITLSTTPWMDFTQSWDDKKLADYFGFTKQELRFIADRIPAYYDDVEPLV